MTALTIPKTTMLRMIHKNVPLSQWCSFRDMGDGLGFSLGGKKTEKSPNKSTPLSVIPKLLYW